MIPKNGGSTANIIDVNMRYLKESSTDICINNCRWDYLHDLEKIKYIKLEQMKNKFEKEKELKFNEECTFKPTFYSKKTTAKVIRGHTQPVTKGSLDSHPNTLTNNNNNDTSGYNNMLTCDVVERSVLWEKKRKNKVENIKQHLSEKEVEECNFYPRTV